MNPLNTWLIEPIDPVLFRDGRPFTAVPGSRATSLPLPPPSTLAGAVRTRHGQDERGRFDVGRLEEVKQLTVLGPMPVLLDEEGEIAEHLMPAPADAVELEAQSKDGQRTLRWLQPLRVPEGGVIQRPELAPVGMSRPDRRKPYKGALPLWRWESELRPWLEQPGDRQVPTGGWGVPAPGPEPRMHVSIDPGRGTAARGALFSVEGRSWLSREHRMAAVVMTDAVLRPGVGPLGGERRMVRWSPSRTALPDCPPAVLESVREARAARLLLLTPALFEGGSTPRRLLEHQAVKRLVGVAHGRAQVISGWDMAARQGRGAPKPTLRIDTASEVYYHDLRH